jgi:3-oxoacyl-[acyl-carrier-protein] synthase-1
MRAALDSAGLVASDIDSINLHGTGTRANDAMEDAAIALVFGDKTPCASTKGFTGHTMGSCGIVEAILTKICLQTGLLVRCLGVDRVDPDFRMNVLTANQDRKLRYALSNAFGFGGINCSLVFGAA